LASLAEDVNVDELRRRARRRLVGAIVLALAAAVIVPMLLESEPHPLGEDVSVRIPPVDDGKFVNRLNDASGKGATASAPAPASSKAAPAPAAESAPKSDAVTPPVTTTEPPAAPGASAPSSAPSASAPAAANQPAASDTSTTKSAASRSASAGPVSAKPSNGGFAVQLAAFSDDKGASALAGRLRRAGYEAYTEPLKTSKGTLWRVRVGPYPSREAATAARDKLKGEGQNGIVAALH
jgi:DedD protein